MAAMMSAAPALGGFLWLLCTILGLALLSNILIAVITEVYTDKRKDAVRLRHARTRRTRSVSAAAPHTESAAAARVAARDVGR